MKTREEILERFRFFIKDETWWKDHESQLAIDPPDDVILELADKLMDIIEEYGCIKLKIEPEI